MSFWVTLCAHKTGHISRGSQIKLKPAHTLSVTIGNECRVDHLFHENVPFSTIGNKQENVHTDTRARTNNVLNRRHLKFELTAQTGAIRTKKLNDPDSFHFLAV